jgi:hypothetical protein
MSLPPDPFLFLMSPGRGRAAFSSPAISTKRAPHRLRRRGKWGPQRRPDPRTDVAVSRNASYTRRMAEARKTVTVVFADVSGSTALGERLDPEAPRRVMQRYFAEAQAALERHGGTVEKFIEREAVPPRSSHRVGRRLPWHVGTRAVQVGSLGASRESAHTRQAIKPTRGFEPRTPSLRVMDCCPRGSAPVTSSPLATRIPRTGADWSGLEVTGEDNPVDGWWTSARLSAWRTPGPCHGEASWRGGARRAAQSKGQSAARVVRLA